MKAWNHFAAMVAASAAALSLGACSNDDGGGANPPGPSFTLTVTVAGTGTVTSAPGGINCPGTCAAGFPSGTVTLTATPGTGFFFAGWSGPNAGTCGNNLSCSVPVSAPAAITATFSPGSATAAIVALTSTNKLISFNRATPDNAPFSSRAITGLAAGESVVGIDFRPASGGLYGLTSASRVCRLSGATGAATACQPLRTDPANAGTAVTLAGTQFGVDFNPAADRLRVISDARENLRIDVDTGATTVDAQLNGAANQATAAAYSNNVPTAPGTVLFVIDDVGHRLFVQDPPNNGTLSAVGTIVDAVTGSTIEFNEVNGFDIVGSGTGINTGNEALAALSVDNQPRLFQIDLGSGRAALQGSITTGEPAGTQVRGLAITPTGTAVATGDTFGLVGGNQLISFNRAAPATILTRTLIAGLAAGDELRGIDFRPRDRKLYALGRLGNLYTINTNSGLATFLAAMTADPADATSPFGGLNTGAQFGMDFIPPADSSVADPLPPSLRIVSSTGANLRVAVEGANLGRVTTDPNVNRDGPNSTQVTQQGIAGIAYTNSFQGVDAIPGAAAGMSTTLFVIDSNNAVLARQAEAAATGIAVGELTNIGNLGVTPSTVNGFDIDGVAGEALSALTVPGNVGARLYTINLATGAVTERGPIGDGTLPVGGLALVPPQPVFAFGLTDEADPRLVSFAPATPGTLITGPTPIRDMVSGDRLVGIDFRPDGVLIGVGTSGNIYTIDPAITTGLAGPSHRAQLVAAMRASINDNTNPFASLANPSEFGFDFDPTLPVNASSLRIVSQDGAQYLRTDSTTGATFTDPPVELPAPGVPPNQCMAAAELIIGGAAYARNGTLFVINADPMATCLYTAPPGGGEMTIANGTPLFGNGLMGGLDSAVMGFDIVGGHDGLALAAIVGPDSATQSMLYIIGGGAGERGLIGPAGTPIMRGLAVRLRP